MVNIYNSLLMREYLGMKPRIKAIRESKGLKQIFVADKVGVSQQQLSDWERGKAYPRIDRAYKLSEVLNVRIEELYEEGNNE
jgi:putative transcriptional regulator